MIWVLLVADLLVTAWGGFEYVREMRKNGEAQSEGWVSLELDEV